jgi:alkyl hydroperoxide reductase subunit AhpC
VKEVYRIRNKKENTAEKDFNQRKMFLLFSHTFGFIGVIYAAVRAFLKMLKAFQNRETDYGFSIMVYFLFFLIFSNWFV